MSVAEVFDTSSDSHVATIELVYPSVPISNIDSAGVERADSHGNRVRWK